MDTRPLVSLERNNAGQLFIGVTEFDSAGLGKRSYVLVHQTDDLATSVIVRRFEDLRILIGDDRAVFEVDFRYKDPNGD